MHQSGKWFLGSAGILVLVYSVVVLGYVATSPDIRLRCLTVDDRDDALERPGVLIHATPDLQYRGNKPEKGDILIRLGDRNVTIRNFVDFNKQLTELRKKDRPPPGGSVEAGTDLTELGDALPPLVEEPDGKRWVEVQFFHKGQMEPLTSALLIQSLPFDEVALSFFWFTLQLVLMAIGALAYWNRPFDHAARMFFIMCIVTLGSFVGGYHWWVISGNLWLNVPFTICSMLLPAVLLHFFLIFPKPKSILRTSKIPVLLGLYTLPVIWIAFTLGLEAHTSWLSHLSESADINKSILDGLSRIRTAVYVFLAISAVYFAFALYALYHSLATSRNLLERGQLKWMWRGALLAAFFVAYTLYLVVFRRTEFALGASRIPIFFASLSFMVAYTVGIFRYKLLSIDQLTNKGVVYYLASASLTIAVGLAIGLGALIPQLFKISLAQYQTVMVTVVLTLAAVMVISFRDAIQRVIDRHFFREKYQLDKALQQMNRAVGQLVDPESLSELMLSSCHDVLGVSRAALYWRANQQTPFQLVATKGESDFPFQLNVQPVFLQALKDAGSYQRISSGSRSAGNILQDFLKETQSVLVHALEVNDEIAGIVLLGEKNSAAPYSAEDLTFLNALGQITNVALLGSKVGHEIDQLNDELKHKLEVISDQKRRIALLQTELTSTQEQPENGFVPGLKDLNRDCLKGNSPALERIFSTVQKVAGSDSSVLVRGESGTGKELLAQILHENSPRKKGPLVKVHCASLSTGLLESELFGHVKGAFTGAYKDKIGRFEMANRGTLFLDEIGEIALDTQIKLLRVLQERCFEPVGGTQTIHVDVRLITATHRNLEKLMIEGQFREDLYYRLNVIGLTMPPLRERMEDIFELALHFLNRSAKRTGKRIRYMDDEVLTALENYSWPGNVRELENVIERAVVLTESDKIQYQDLPDHVREGTISAFSSESEIVEVLPQRISSRSTAHAKPVLSVARTVIAPENESEMLKSVLEKCGGNKAQAARMMGIPRSTFFSKLKKHKLV